MALSSHWLITLSPGLGGTTPLPIGVAAPNPAETVWRLGIGGVVTSPRSVPGFDLILVTALYNNGVSVGYTPDPALEAVVWRGDDQPNLFFPEVLWISAVAGTLQLSIPAADTIGLEPGHYRLRVGLTVGDVRLLAFDGGLDIAEVPGSDLDRTPYVTNRDLLFYYDQLSTLQNYTSDETGFAEQRVDASDQFDRMLIERYNPRPGFVRNRNPTYDPILGYDVPDPALVPPSKADLTAYLSAGGLIVEQKAREMVARMTIALILDRQETQDQNPYREHAQTMRDRVTQLWAGYQAQIDSNSNAVPDYLIDRDVIFLPAGAAP